MMRVLSHRVDALTVAYRVNLDPSFVKALREASDVAKKHGRSKFEFAVLAPDDDGDGTTTAHGRHKLGPLPLRWANEADRVRRVKKVWGELSYNRVDKCWRVVNQPYYRMQVLLNADGGGAVRDCPGCRGTGRVAASVGQTFCPRCQGRGIEEEAGWTVEIIYYAQTLARWGLEKTLADAAALASTCGEVLETRLRRIDLCADVAGWDVNQDELLDRLVKRPQAEWRKWNPTDDVEKDEAYSARAVVPRAKPGKVDADDIAAVYGKGTMLRRRVTGVVVGRGDVLARIYNKRAELERNEERRECEEERWRANGWDGVTPVTRVEFQLRSAVLTELGIRDPDAVLVPVTRRQEYEDARGRMRARLVVTGHEVMTTPDGRQATVCDRLDDIWRACLDWVRLIEPKKTSSGGEIAPSRLDDDARWKLLRALRFTDQAPRPLRRYRARAAASAPMALGVSLSQAAKEGRLVELAEARDAYADDERTEAWLVRVLVKLKVAEAHRIAAWMVDKFEGPAGAAEHFAVRNNSARMRHHRGVDEDDEHEPPLVERPPPLWAAQVL